MFTLARSIQNLLRWSDTFSASAWTKSSLGVQTDATSFVDGSLADKLCELAINSYHYVTQNSSANVGDAITIRSRVKAAERSYALVEGYNGSAFPSAYFDLALGTADNTTTCSNSIINIGDGWYECAIHFAMVASGQLNAYTMPISSKNGNPIYLGVASSGIYCAGMSVTRTTSAGPYTSTDSAAAFNDHDFIGIDPIKFARNDELIQNTHRMKSGGGFRYIWGRQPKAKFNAMVDSATACGINSWWAANVPVVLQQNNDPSFVMSCYITNKKAPFMSFREGNNTLWMGAIELEGF